MNKQIDLCQRANGQNSMVITFLYSESRLNGTSYGKMNSEVGKLLG